MAQNESPIPKRRRWLKWLAGLAAGLVVLVVVLYFVVTSAGFFKGFILPKIGRALNADVSVSGAEISPFSKVVLQDLKVTPKGGEPVFSATTVIARYNLRAILAGHIVIDEAAIVSPTVTVIESADGTSNLSSLGSSEKPKVESKPAAPVSKPSPPPSLDIRSVRLENATIRYSKNGETIELTQVNLTAASIKNGATGKLTFGAAIAANKHGSAMQAKCDGAFTIAFLQDMQPGAVNGAVSLSIDKATGEFLSLDKLATKLDCDVTVDQRTQSATVKTLHLVGTQKQRPLLRMELSDPMTVAWGSRQEKVPDATLNFAVTDLNLADWKPLAGDAVPEGVANLTLKVVSQNAGQQLTFDLDGHVDRLTTSLALLDVRVRANGRVESLRQFNVTECRLDVAQQKQSVLTIDGSGTFDRQTENADVQVTIKSALSRLATLVPQTNFVCRTGQLELTGRVTSGPQSQTVTGQLTLTDFTGHYDEYQFDKFGATLDLEVAMKGDQVEIHKIVGQLRGGGKLDVSGNYDGNKKSGKLDVKLADFHESDLRPFLQPSLGKQKLVSITLSTTANAGFDATGAGDVKADLQVADLVVQDPASKVAATPLEARLQVDATGKKRVLTMRECQLTLTPTARANNELRLSGTVDYAKSNAITGNLKLTATALDLTKYYDLFAGTNVATEASAPATLAQPTTKSNTVVVAKEPEATTMPLKDFTFTVAIDRCYLRELDIANLQTTAKLDGGHVVLEPLQLTLNGGPINSSIDLDLGVPGYQYDLAMTADNVPLGPLADSFSPTYRDSANGILSGKLQLKGAGTTGRSLRKHLTGKVTLSVTNANIQIVGAKTKAILTPISVALGAPELLNKPLDYLATDLRFGHGEIEVREFTARSAAVLAESPGTIPIADMLADSPLDQPINLSLSRQLAKRLHPNTPIEEGYAKWPTMVRLVGTVGDPSTKTVVGQTVEAVTNALSKTTSTIKKSWGKMFSGGTTNSAGSTNSSFRPLNLFKKSEDE